jgi:prepilin-type processing-associated H-X9-DG protein/prepilin-type N-terminal cleavage/methylation domain-containing protein
MKYTTRPGVTLIEVLVVISITSLLVALLLPAVVQVRSAAERLSCQSQLRQISLAMQNYESATGKLPPAMTQPPGYRGLAYLQWTYHLAGYMELDAHWRKAEEDYARQPDPFTPTQHRGFAQPIKVYSCPSDHRTLQTWNFTFLYSLARPRPTIRLKTALNSYIGNGGDLSQNRNGIMLTNGGVTMQGITDGTSNTLAFGERPPPSSLHFGWVYAAWGANAGGNGELAAVLGVRDKNTYTRLPYDHPLKVCGSGPFPFQMPDTRARTDCTMFQYWSLHDGGANFAFADGSVRFLPYSADTILPALATRNGGEVVELP